MNVYGELIRAQLENLTANPSPALAGRLWWRTDLNRAYVDWGGAVYPLLGAPTVQKFTSTGTTTGYLFNVSTTSTVAVGDTYTNNAHTFTVLVALTAQSGWVLFCSGALAPAASGDLTRATGAGTATITFTTNQAMGSYTTPTAPAPLYLKVTMVGGGGGAGSSGSGSFGPAGAGTPSGFSAGVMIAASAAAASSIGSGIGFVINSSAAPNSGVSGTTIKLPGVTGASSALGGAGAGGAIDAAGGNAQTNSGSGGGGGGGSSSNAITTGNGGTGGGFVSAIVNSPASTYFYCVGSGGAGGTAGTNGFAGGNGAAGLVVVEEFYQ